MIRQTREKEKPQPTVDFRKSISPARFLAVWPKCALVTMRPMIDRQPWGNI